MAPFSTRQPRLVSLRPRRESHSSRGGLRSFHVRGLCGPFVGPRDGGSPLPLGDGRRPLGDGIEFSLERRRPRSRRPALDGGLPPPPPEPSFFRRLRERPPPLPRQRRLPRLHVPRLSPPPPRYCRYRCHCHCHQQQQQHYRASLRLLQIHPLPLPPPRPRKIAHRPLQTPERHSLPSRRGGLSLVSRPREIRTSDERANSEMSPRRCPTGRRSSAGIEIRLSVGGFGAVGGVVSEVVVVREGGVRGGVGGVGEDACLFLGGGRFLDEGE
mmetsp:Transcript_28380/g.60719  ORF Transcript_28380/g.60719 Transcript_28380/m.60719 type:complete len:270 (-) Transcript_28380:913-1722(-)